MFLCAARSTRFQNFEARRGRRGVLCNRDVPQRHAGTLIWQHLLSATSGAEGSFGEAFYFSVVTFLTIGYGDMAPASDTGKVYFILYCIASLIVQLTIVSELLSTAISFRPTDPEDVQGGAQRVSHPRVLSHGACAPGPFICLAPSMQ